MSEGMKIGKISIVGKVSLSWSGNYLVFGILYTYLCIIIIKADSNTFEMCACPYEGL